MRVKINETWYDSFDNAICIEINEEEQKHISSMDRSIAEEGKYASFPCDCKLTTDEMFAWMEG